MDIIRETSSYATQFEHDTLKAQAERQLSFANIWLNFVRKKKSTSMSQYPITLPMWLLPGVQFLRHICLLHFTDHIENSLFSEFYRNLQRTMRYLNNSYRSNSPTLSHIRSKPSSQVSLIAKQKANRARKNKLRFTRIEQLERMDRRIDRQRADDGLIGHIKLLNKPSFISKKVEDDLASLKIRNFHKINLLARGQFATSKTFSFFSLSFFVRSFVRSSI